MIRGLERMRMLSCLAVVIGWSELALAQSMTDAFGFVPPNQPPYSGIIALAGDGPEYEIKPGDPAHVIFHLGQKTLVAGRDIGQGTALVLDGAGNLAADGLPVTIHIGHDSHVVQLENGLASHRFVAGTKAGRLHAGADAEAVQSVRAEVEIVADLDRIAPATAHALFGKREDYLDTNTSPLTDTYGNPLPEGIHGQILLDHDASEISIIPMQGSGAYLRGRLLTRDIPDTGTGRLVLGAVALTEIDFGLLANPLVAPPAAYLTRLESLNAFNLTLGPFQTLAGHALNDGAMVTLTLTTAQGEILRDKGWLRDGLATFMVMVSTDSLPLQAQIETVAGKYELTLSEQTFQ